MVSVSRFCRRDKLNRIKTVWVYAAYCNNKTVLWGYGFSQKFSGTLKATRYYNVSPQCVTETWHLVCTNLFCPGGKSLGSISAVSRVRSLILPGGWVWAHFPEQRLVIEPSKSLDPLKTTWLTVHYSLMVTVLLFHSQTMQSKIIWITSS